MGLDLDHRLSVAVDLLAVQSTADRPDQLRRAVDSVIDFVGESEHKIVWR